jgi:hypothetical protein
MEKRKEIRILNPDIILLEQLSKLAKENKRTIGKQAEYMLEWFIKNNK